jgi:secondary thiamine-phosphate synthase enzyme
MKLTLSQNCAPVKTTAKAKDEGETTTTTKRVMSSSSSSGFASLVTSRVARDARDALHPVATGVCHVCLVNDANASGVTINENCDPAVRRDVMRAFSELEFDATVMKRSVSVPILSGAMAFGTWQGLYLCNFKNDNNDKEEVLIRTTVRESDFKKTKRGEFVAPRRGCHDATTTIATTVDITDVKTGVLNVMIKHTSASLTINDRRKAEELESGLNTLIPESWNDTFLEHTMEGPDDCPAHIKATILGETMNVPIRDGKLVLSSENEHILLCEHRNVGGYGGGFRREFIATVNEAKAQEVVKLTVDKNRKLVNVSEAVRAFVTKANDATIEVVHVFSPKGGVFMSTADEAEVFLEHLDKKVSSNAVLKSSVIGASEMLVVEDGDGRKMFAEGLECFVVTNDDDGEEEEEEDSGVGLVVFTAL